MNNFINTQATDLARAKTVGLANLLTQPFPVLTVGSQSTQSFFFANNGVIESWSGAPDYTLRLTVGDVASGPVGLTYTATVGSGTPIVIPFDLDASGLENQLNLDATVITEGGVQVTQQGDGRFLIAHRALGVVAALTSDPALLVPGCEVSVQVLATGSSSVAQLVMLTIRRTIPLQTTSFSPISLPYAGWQGTVTLDSAAAIELIRLNGIRKGAYLECTTLLTVEVIDGSANATTYYQTPITLRALNYSVAAASTNMTQNFFARPNVVGLASNAASATLLGGLSTASGEFPIGSTVQCLFTNDVVANFIRKPTTSNQAVPFIVRPYDYNVSSNPYQWVLDRVTKEAQICTWNADTAQWHYQIDAGATNAVYISADQTGFSLPS